MELRNNPLQRGTFISSHSGNIPMNKNTRIVSLGILFGILGASVLLIDSTVSAQEDAMSGDSMKSGDAMEAMRGCINNAMMSGDSMKSGDAMMSGDSMKSGDAMMSGDTDVKTYEVTITNITPGQPLTPPLLVTHSADAGIFTLGQAASDELQQLAENGNTVPLKEKLEAGHVCDIVMGDGPLVPATVHNAGAMHQYTSTYEVVADYKHHYLSFASMLICTNDGFVGLDSIDLLNNEGSTYLAVAYDAGTEINTEDFADLVPPCQALMGISSDDEGTGSSNLDTAEDGIVIPHPGVFQRADLTPDHAWSDPVAIITISLLE